MVGLVTDKTLVCDLDGVVYVGDRAIPGSARALRDLEDQGWRVLFCTNNSSRTRSAVAEKIERVSGYPARVDQVFTSAMAAARIVQGCTGVLVVGGPGIHEALEEHGVPVVEDGTDCDVVMVGLDLELTYEKLARATLAVRAGARLVATNHDATYPSTRGLLPGGGAIVSALETATDIEAVVAGKPHQPMRDLLAQAVVGEVWMVGDRSDTDLAMAAAAGWHGALVATGVPHTGSAATPELSVADLAAFAEVVSTRG